MFHFYFFFSFFFPPTNKNSGSKETTENIQNVKPYSVKRQAEMFFKNTI